MAIVVWPDDITLDQIVCCVTCHREVRLEDATAGGLDVDGRQAFACNAHFLSGARLIVGWIDFALEQDGAVMEMAKG